MSLLKPSDKDPVDDTFVRSIIRLGVFHVLNVGLSNIAFVLVVCGSLLGLVTIPLCCLGIIILRVVLFLVAPLAELDVVLYNYVSPPSEHVYVSATRQDNLFEFSGLRLAPNLSSLSPSAVYVALYFGTVKFAIGALSSLVLSITFSMPIAALTRDSAKESYFHSWFSTLSFIFFTLVFMAIGGVLMKLVARLSRSSTRYFCCEKYSTYDYVHSGLSVPSYGTTEKSEA